MSLVITSPANPRVKMLAGLKRRRNRDAAGTFPIEGSRVVRRALDASWPLDEAFFAPGLATADAHAVAHALHGTGIEITELGDDAFRRAAYREHPDGIIAVGRTSKLDLDQLDLGAQPLLLVVEGIEKPGNLGAMLRTADGVGADAVIVATPTADVWNPNVVRASQGALFTVAVAARPAVEVAAWLADMRIAAVAAVPRAGAPAPWGVDLTGPVALVVGSEHAGLSDVWQGSIDVAIPMRGAGDSLNASVAAAVLLYEARRQRS